MKIFDIIWLAMVLILTLGMSAAAFFVKDVKEARETFELIRAARAGILFFGIFIMIFVPFEHGLAKLGLASFIAWPLAVFISVLLPFLMLALFVFETDIGLLSSLLIFIIIIMPCLVFYMWVAGGWELVDQLVP